MRSFEVGYTGEVGADGLRHGRGREASSDGSVYTGDWVHNKKTGTGK